VRRSSGSGPQQHLGRGNLEKPDSAGRNAQFERRGDYARIEPEYRNLYVKSNLAGEFTAVNESLVEALKAHRACGTRLAADLKYYDGSLAQIERLPVEGRIDALDKRAINGRTDVNQWVSFK
jgi:hypothetical protein